MQQTIKASSPKFDLSDLCEMYKYFHGLCYDHDENTIKGCMKFRCYYKKKENRSRWDIHGCIEQSLIGVQVIDGEYDIHIELNRMPPKVVETSGKIRRLGEQLNRSDADMHLNSDGSCCLDLYVSIGSKSIWKFVLNRVYPYFVWQAYIEQYKEIPPCGAFPHNREQARAEFIQDCENLRRNDFCLCGSGKKFKICCKEVETIMKKVEPSRGNSNIMNRKGEDN